MFTKTKPSQPLSMISKTIQRNFVKITDIIPDHTKKAYGYVTPDKLTENGKKYLNKIYDRTEYLENNKHLLADSLSETLEAKSFGFIKKLTEDLQNVNPNLKCQCLGISTRHINETAFHDDTNIGEKFVLIRPCFPRHMQTFVFPNNSIFTQTKHAGFYKVLPSVDFKPHAIEAYNAIPHNAIASAFYTLGTGGLPLIHAAPFDINNDELIQKLAENGETNSFEGTQHNTEIRKRPVIVWTLEEKNLNTH